MAMQRKDPSPMDGEVIHILLVEDNPGDARLVREMLADAVADGLVLSAVDLVQAERLDEALQRLAETRFDVVLLDLSLPDSQGLDTFIRAQARSSGMPIVVLTGFADEAMAIKAVRKGAQDYLVKGQVDSHLLVRAVRYAIERKRAEEELRLLQATTLAIGEAEDLHSAMSIVLCKVCEATGWILGRAWMPRPDGVLLECSPAWYGRLESLEQFQKASEAMTFAPGCGLPGRVWSSKRPAWVRDVTSDENFPRAPIAGEVGLKAGVAIPVLAGREVVAVLEFFLSEPREEDARFVRLVSAAAAQLGALIQRKRAEEELRRVNRELKTLSQLLEKALDGTSTGLCVMNRDLRPLWINNRWRQWFAPQTLGLRPGRPKRAAPESEVGLPQESGLFAGPSSPAPGEACQSPSPICFEPETALVEPSLPWEIAGEGSAARQALQDGLLRVTERLLPASGDRSPDSPRMGWGQRVFQVTTAPLPDKDGNIGQVVELVQDITEQKRIQAQIMRTGKMAAVGELAGEVAHEVNNPIAIISAKARLLVSDYQDEMPAKVVQELGKIIDLSDRVARIAQGLLSYCRPSAATRTRLDIRTPVQRALGMIEQHARRSGVEIEEHFADPAPVVEANVHEIEQVCLNLFLNALDAMPHGGRLTVSIRHEQGGRLPDGASCAAILVQDTGIGIPPEIRENIFDPFFSTKEEGQGSGLGLSICLGIVQSHGGEIEVDSETGRGTCFTVRLPAEPRADDEETPHG